MKVNTKLTEAENVYNLIETYLKEQLKGEVSLGGLSIIPGEDLETLTRETINNNRPLTLNTSLLLTSSQDTVTFIKGDKRTISYRRKSLKKQWNILNPFPLNIENDPTQEEAEQYIYTYLKVIPASVSVEVDTTNKKIKVIPNASSLVYYDPIEISYNSIVVPEPFIPPEVEDDDIPSFEYEDAPRVCYLEDDKVHPFISIRRRYRPNGKQYNTQYAGDRLPTYSYITTNLLDVETIFRRIYQMELDLAKKRSPFTSPSMNDEKKGGIKEVEFQYFKFDKELIIYKEQTYKTYFKDRINVWNDVISLYHNENTDPDSLKLTKSKLYKHLLVNYDPVNNTYIRDNTVFARLNSYWKVTYNNGEVFEDVKGESGQVILELNYTFPIKGKAVISKDHIVDKNYIFQHATGATPTRFKEPFDDNFDKVLFRVEEVIGLDKAEFIRKVLDEEKLWVSSEHELPDTFTKAFRMYDQGSWTVGEQRSFFTGTLSEKFVLEAYKTASDKQKDRKTKIEIGLYDVVADNCTPKLQEDYIDTGLPEDALFVGYGYISQDLAPGWLLNSSVFKVTPTGGRGDSSRSGSSGGGTGRGVSSGGGFGRLGSGSPFGSTGTSGTGGCKSSMMISRAFTDGGGNISFPLGYKSSSSISGLYSKAKTAAQELLNDYNSKLTDPKSPRKRMTALVKTTEEAYVSIEEDTNELEEAINSTASGSTPTIFVRSGGYCGTPPNKREHNYGGEVLVWACNAGELVNTRREDGLVKITASRYSEIPEVIEDIYTGSVSEYPPGDSPLANFKGCQIKYVLVRDTYGNDGSRSITRRPDWVTEEQLSSLRPGRTVGYYKAYFTGCCICQKESYTSLWARGFEIEDANLVYK